MTANGYTNGVNGTYRSKHDLSSLKIDQSRLLDSLHTSCKFGEAWRYGEYVPILYTEFAVSAFDTFLVTQQRPVWLA